MSVIPPSDPKLQPLLESLEEPPVVLLVEDSVPQARAYMAYLEGEPYDIDHVETVDAAYAQIRSGRPMLVLLDIRLPDGSGLDVLRTLRAEDNPIAVVMITSHGSVNVAVEAMQAGANDFLVKPFTQDRLQVTLRNVLERQILTQQVETLRAEVPKSAFLGFVGSSPAMQAVYQVIESAAGSMATVFVTGESGTGKELAAEALHNHSPRRRGPFVPINCGAIPHDLMESEIFGHVKGAFTGAVGDREGAAQRAHGGTLFLDEICEMDLSLQTKLLRFLQTGKIQKVGDDRLVPVDVRIVCATNRDPMDEVRAGRFREDLFYRLHVIPIQLPPLRERGRDVLEVAQHYLAKITAEEGKRFLGFSEPAEAAIRAYAWPGNVRQMVNILRNIVVLNDGEEITPAMLPEGIIAARSFAKSRQQRERAADAAAASGDSIAPMRAATEAPILPLWKIEKQAIEKALERCNGNVPRAAALLEVSPSTLYRKLQHWGGTK